MWVAVSVNPVGVVFQSGVCLFAIFIIISDIHFIYIFVGLFIKIFVSCLTGQMSLHKYKPYLMLWQWAEALKLVYTNNLGSFISVGLLWGRLIYTQSYPFDFRMLNLVLNASCCSFCHHPADWLKSAPNYELQGSNLDPRKENSSVWSSPALYCFVLLFFNTFVQSWLELQTHFIFTP